MSEHLIVSGFRYFFRVLNEDDSVAGETVADNLITGDGMEFLMRSPFGDVSPIGNFYCGLWRGNVIPSKGLKATDIPSNLQEFVGYSESSRPEWQRQYDGNGTLDNSDQARIAEFSFTADANLHGAFLVSDPGKGQGSGLLLSCVRFPTPRPVTAGQKGQLIAGITYVSANVI